MKNDLPPAWLFQIPLTINCESPWPGLILFFTVQESHMIIMHRCDCVSVKALQKSVHVGELIMCCGKVFHNLGRRKICNFPLWFSFQLVIIAIL